MAGIDNLALKNPKIFDLQEAVILLDVYLSFCKKGTSWTKAARIASMRLRDLAQNRGITINDEFRNAMSLQYRLHSIGHIFEGEEASSAPATLVFYEAVSLYNNYRAKYKEILREVTSDSPAWKDVAKAKDKQINKTKFVRTRKDAALKKNYGDSFSSVYYALKRGSDKKPSGLTATDIFVALDRKVMRKDIIDILDGASWAKQIKEARYVFYDKDLERRKQKQMNDSIKTAEQEFLSWLSSTVPPFAVEKINNSYKSISALLVQKKALPQSLLATTQIGQVESALRMTKKVFGSKKTRATAQSLLNSYLTYLREKKNKISEEVSPEIEVQEGWIKFDFTNSSQFDRTVPTYCSIKGNEIKGKNWARILVGIVEQEIEKKNPALDVLYKQSLLTNRNDTPFFLKKKKDKLNCSELSNGYWLNVNHSIPRLMVLIQTFCLQSGYSKNDVIIYGALKSNACVKSSSGSSRRETGNGVSIDKAEEFLRKVDLKGATVQELIDAVQPGAAVYPTRLALEGSKNCIAMPNDRFVHVGAFFELDEAEEKMEHILRTHFAQFGGYSNNKLLFGAASHDLSLFLNDNDCEEMGKVYSLAQYFFGKKSDKVQFKFSYPHIFEKEPDYPPNLKGLMINLARTNGGILNEEDAKSYLEKTSLSYSTLGQLLQISSTNTFLLYDENKFLLSESIGIDSGWIKTFHDKLDSLFRQANVAYIIPRDINKESWLQTLPALPQGLPWTILLLQEVLKNYPDIGFKPITSQIGQANTTIAAAIVPTSSELQTFPDVVTLYMQDKFTLPKQMSREELRLILRDAGMLEGNELIYALHKALNDYRFAWKDENKTVLVRGN